MKSAINTRKRALGENFSKSKLNGFVVRVSKIIFRWIASVRSTETLSDGSEDLYRFRIKSAITLGFVKKYFNKRSELRYSKNFLQLFGVMMASAGIVIGAYATLTNWIIPMVRALSETTKTMPADVPFNQVSYASDSGMVMALSNEVRLSTSSAWVNGAYLAKKTVTIKNLSGQILSATGSASITVNTKELFDAGKLQADCDDLRVAHIASTSANVRTEIARSIQVAAGATDCSNSTATIVTFPRQEKLWIGQSTENYEIYYANPDAEAPDWVGDRYLWFDGTSDFVQTPYAFNSNIGSVDGGYSWESWVYPEAAGSIMTSTFDSNYSNGTSLRVANNTTLTWDGTGTTISANIPTGLYNRWSHVVVVARKIDTSTTEYKLYWNGSLLSSGTSTKTFGTQQVMRVGLVYAGYTQYGLFKGRIDEVSVYSRPLSESEILMRHSDNNNIISGLSLNYKFNEIGGQTVTDSSGNARHGTLGIDGTTAADDPSRSLLHRAESMGDKKATLVCPFAGSTTCLGGVTPSTATGAIRFATGSAVLFDGKDDYITSPLLDHVTRLGIYSVSVWIKPTKLSGQYTIFGNSISTSDRNAVTLNGNTLSFGTWNGSAWQGVSGSIVQDAWTHVVGINSGGVLSLYLNGVSQSGSVVPYTANFSNYLYIGQSGATNNYYVGYMDELAVFSNGLTSTQVTNLYNNGAGTKSEPDANTKLLYHFDESGDDPRNTGKVFDASGNGNHGTITGAKYVSGVVGVDSGAGSTVTGVGAMANGNFASHQGVFIEEGTTNLVTNPSFENSTFNTNWYAPTFTYATASATFTPNMAKRNSAGPFAAGPMVQGDVAGTVGDSLLATTGTQITTNFNANFDRNQGSISLWVTPEWNGNDGKTHRFVDWYGGSSTLSKFSDGKVYFYMYPRSMSVDVSSWTAGSTYHVVARWDSKNTIDGTNYLCLSVNDVTTCGSTSAPDPTTGYTNIYIGGQQNYAGQKADAIIEGLTIYRRVLYDGTYGTNVGNGDEINLIYNGGTGKDPTLVTGSWDVVFALPTNGSTGTLATGTGNAWSMPHSSNLLGGTNGKNGFMMDGDAGNDGFVYNSTNSLFNNLVSFWKLGEASGSRLDSVGNNHLTDNNTVTQTTGKVGNASQFAAANSEYLSINDNADLSTGDIDFTVSGWVYLTDKSISRPIIQKGPGWAGQLEYVLYYRSDTDRFRFHVGTGDYNTYGLVNASSAGSPQLNTWYYVVGWHDSVNNTVNIQVNGGAVDSTSYSLGGYDSADPLKIGMMSGGYMNGAIDSVGFWKRVLSSDERSSLYNEGRGTEYPFVSPLPTSQKVFNGGYAVPGNQWEGVYKDITVTPGQDVVLRGIAHSDGVSTPRIVIYDQTNGVDIGSLNGTTTSTRLNPDILLFTAEAPAGCTTMRIKLVNASGTASTVNWHQVEVYNNLITNPSMEGAYAGTPPTPPGWSNALTEGKSEKETTITRSGLASLKYNTGAAPYWGVSQGISATVGNFYSVGAFIYGDGSAGARIESAAISHLETQAGGAVHLGSKVTPVWNHSFGVYRAKTTSPGMHLNPDNGAIGGRYLDDVYVVGLDPVSLTVTPASSANSTEASGIRVDGMDTLTQPITGLSTTNGVIKFKFTPRHNFADSDNFGSTYPVIFKANYDNNNYLELISMAPWNNLELRSSFNGTYKVGVWSNPVLSAGMTYLIEVAYRSGGSLSLKVDGVEKASVGGVVDFGIVPTTMYFGTASSGVSQYDATYSSFVTASVTENATAPYYKFGNKSAKIVAYDSADQYLTTATASANSAYTLSAYVYDGTTGNVGGIIDANIAQLASGSAALATTYTDMGGGWWRLTNTSATIPAGTYKLGVQVQAGKTIYVDGVQLEAKAYATTYADGSLGTGYAWSGTANQSTSTRTLAALNYSASSASVGQGSFSVWFKNPQGWNHNIYSRFVSLGSNAYIGHHDSTNCIFGWGNLYTYSTNCTSWGNEHTWQFFTVVWNGSTATWYRNGQVFLTGSYTTPPTFSSIAIGHTTGSNSVSDFRLFDQALTAADISDLYYQGLSTYSTSVEKVDRFVSSGTYTSPVIDLGANGAWGGVPANFTSVLNGGTVSYMTRSSADSNTWSDWVAQSGSAIASDPRRYFQWKADMTAPASMATSPVLTGATFKYVEDSTPPVNVQETALGFSTISTPSADLASGSWANFATPKFTWNAGVDDAASGQSASGIEGYMMLLTKTADATPSASVASSCYKYALEGARSFEVGTSPSGCTLTDGIWYLRSQVKDNSGNVSDPVTLFTYKYDGSIPNAPISIASTTVGYSANNGFGFYWPAGTDNGPSGVLGYEYKTGASEGALSQWQFTSATMVEGIEAYKEGQNFIYVRTVDQSGNVSGIASNNLTVASFYYNASAPTAPTNIAISPNTTEEAQSAENVFTVTWDKPASFSGEIAKYFYCVNCTPSETNMTETTAAETVNRTLSNIALATQQGKNTLYIIAEDNNINTATGHGNRNFSAYATADFFAETIAPVAPSSVSLNDASDRDASLWRLSLTWKTASEGGAVAKYQVYRSIDNLTYVKLGETTSTAYTDADLVQSTKYFYKVRAVDNAGSTSLFSTTVYRSPEGKYTTPPTIGGVPAVTPGSSTAIVKWTTGREAFGTVEYGKTSSYGSGSTEAVMTKDHSIKLTGLAPGVTYHFRTQSLDDSAMTDYDRTAAYSGDYTFTTLNSAAISTVTVEEVDLTTAVISWMTSSLATSTIEYGETMEYGLSQDVTTSASESAHISRLTGLKHSTKYNFRVRGITSDGDDIFSENYVFSTLMFPKVTAVVLNTDQGAGGASVVLAWATNVPTTGEVEYQALEPERNLALADLQNMSQTNLASVSATPVGKSLIAYSGKMEDKHLMRLDGLQDGMIYVFTIRGRDNFGNQVISDPIRYVTGEDTRPPQIFNIVIETPLIGNGGEAKASAIISWETDEPAVGQILWGVGTGTEYSNKSEMDAMPTTKHTIVLRDLLPTTSYHLKIESEDATGNKSASQDTVVVTPTAQQAALDIVLKNLEDVFGFLRW